MKTMRAKVVPDREKCARLAEKEAKGVLRRGEVQ
jgi:hypothetical protein